MSYQRCEFERRLKRTTRRQGQLNSKLNSQPDGMDEFVTLEALSGAGICEGADKIQLAMPGRGQCSRKSGQGTGGWLPLLFALLLLLLLLQVVVVVLLMQFSNIVVVSVIARILIGVVLRPRRITPGIMSKLSVKWHLGFIYTHAHTRTHTHTSGCKVDKDAKGSQRIATLKRFTDCKARQQTIGVAVDTR